jgi:hypothetical protein
MGTQVVYLKQINWLAKSKIKAQPLAMLKKSKETDIIPSELSQTLSLIDRAVDSTYQKLFL